jgi:hypothetical protein
MIEYLIYGNYPNDDSTLESLLVETDLRPTSFGQPITEKETALEHVRILESKGFKNLRLATFDGSPPNFSSKNLLNI